jgi:16S rRNA (guanine966-N2)-methyltransferase
MTGCLRSRHYRRGVRVVSGSARGRRLEVPRGSSTRPTTDRVREAVFNALASRGLARGITAVDLFAGTGALGIEALSRGADEVVFVERDRSAMAVVRANLAATGLQDRAHLVTSSAESWLDSPDATGRTFDVAFCDPPYAFDAWDDLLGRIPADLVVIESDRLIEVEGWEFSRQRRYGTTFVMFAEPSVGRPDRPAPSAQASELP